jgi:hypothetical protein
MVIGVGVDQFFSRALAKPQKQNLLLPINHDDLHFSIHFVDFRIFLSRELLLFFC